MPGARLPDLNYRRPASQFYDCATRQSEDVRVNEAIKMAQGRMAEALSPLTEWGDCASAAFHQAPTDGALKFMPPGAFLESSAE
jgi:hypothetical protein